MILTQKALSTFLCILILLTVFSCNHVFNADEYKINQVEATPFYALPLAFGDLSIQDILSPKDSQYVKVSSDGLVYLDYNQTLKTQAIRDLINIPDKKNVTATLPVPPGVQAPVNNDFTSTQISLPVKFDLNPEQLTEVFLKNGALSCNIDLIPAHPTFKYAVQITIPEFTDSKTGIPFSTEAPEAISSFPLSNYLLKTAVPNQITVIFTLVIKKNPNSVTILPGTNVMIDVSFTDMDYRYAKGFFGDQSVTIPAQTLPIRAFGTSLLKGATVSFVQPKVEFEVVNEVGVPTKIYFTSLEADKPGSSLPIQISPASPVSIQAPVNLGDSALTAVLATNANALINFSPTKFLYEIKARINEGLLAGSNFITDTSKLKVRLHVEIPLYGHASNIYLADTVDIDLSDADKSEILQASLKIKTLNQLPLSATVQAYLTDNAYHILDSLLLPNQTTLIKSSQVNAAGELLLESTVDELQPLSKDKLNTIFKATKIIIAARLYTTKDSNGNYPDVKFKSTYKLNIKLGLQINAKLTVHL